MTDTAPSELVLLWDHPSQLESVWPHARTAGAANVDIAAGAMRLVVDLRPDDPPEPATPPAATAATVIAGTPVDAAYVLTEEQTELLLEGPPLQRFTVTELDAELDEPADPVRLAAWPAVFEEDPPQRCDIDGETFPVDVTPEAAGGPDDGVEGPLMPDTPGPSDPPAPEVEEGVEQRRDSTASVRAHPHEPPAPPSSTPAQLTDQVLALIESAPGKQWSAAQVLEHFPAGRHSSVRATVANLARKDRIRRLSAGIYQAHATGNTDPGPSFPSADADEEPAAELEALVERVCGVLEGDPLRRFTVVELAAELDEPADAVRTAAYRLSAEHRVNQLGPAEFRFLDVADLADQRRTAQAEAQ